MPKDAKTVAVMTVASVLGGLTAYAAPIHSLAIPQTGPSAVVPVHGMMGGYECFWHKGCQYCRYGPQRPWMLLGCKNHHR